METKSTTTVPSMFAALFALSLAACASSPAAPVATAATAPSRITVDMVEQAEREWGDGLIAIGRAVRVAIDRDRSKPSMVIRQNHRS